MEYSFVVDLIFTIIFGIEILLNLFSFTYEVARKEIYIILIIILSTTTLISKLTQNCFLLLE
jgi:hypothetical protein